MCQTRWGDECLKVKMKRRKDVTQCCCCYICTNVSDVVSASHFKRCFYPIEKLWIIEGCIKHSFSSRITTYKIKKMDRYKMDWRIRTLTITLKKDLRRTKYSAYVFYFVTRININTMVAGCPNIHVLNDLIWLTA